MKNKFIKFCEDKTECILIILFVLVMILSALVLLGCNESEQQKQEQNINKIPKYEELKIANIKIVTSGEIKEYTTYSDLILVDDINDFIAFPIIKTLDNGTLKPIWKQYKNCTYSIETKSIEKTRDDGIKSKSLEEYFRCRGIFQINDFLYKQNQKEKERR